MRILGIDYGDKRVGIAITDELGITAQGLKTINNITDKLLLKELESIIIEYGVSGIVVGMPFHMDGGIAERTKITEAFVHKLKCKFNHINISTIDERLTTVEANKTMYFLNIDKTKKKNIVDTLSAVYILEIYLKKQTT